LWQVSDGQMVNNLIEHWDHITSLAFSPNGRLLVSGATDGTVYFWGISEAISGD
jgi:WD40 repeat protein